MDRRRDEMDKQQFDGLVKLFESARDRDGDPLNMHYLLIKQGETEHFHAFGGRTERSDIRSLSKTIMALLAGTVVESRDDVSEETPIWPIIEPAPAQSHDRFRPDSHDARGHRRNGSGRLPRLHRQ
jgi:hypothetical protein